MRRVTAADFFVSRRMTRFDGSANCEPVAVWQPHFAYKPSNKHRSKSRKSLVSSRFEQRVILAHGKRIKGS